MWSAKHWSVSGLRCICFVSLLFSELERLSNLVGKPSENHPLHNSGLLSLDPVQDKTPLYSQLLQAYKWSNKVRATCQKWSMSCRKSQVFLYVIDAEGEGKFFCLFLFLMQNGVTELEVLEFPCELSCSPLTFLRPSHNAQGN